MAGPFFKDTSCYSIEYDIFNYDVNAEAIDDIPLKINMEFISQEYLDFLINSIITKITHIQRFDNSQSRIESLLGKLNNQLSQKNSGLSFCIHDDFISYNCNNIQLKVKKDKTSKLMSFFFFFL